ncbi:MAG: DUF169 domain-containing protein [Thermoplasmata archaeon]|jgi:uncharacterized protein (DUF169 family)
MENKYKEYDEKLKKFLKLRTNPVSIKFMEKNLEETGIPMLRPLQNFHRKFTFCQMVAASRYYEFVIGASLEDMACPGEIIIFGFAEPPDYFLDGSLSFGLYTKTKEDGKKLDNSLPRLQVGKYKGIITMPLNLSMVEPDLVLIYGTPGQMVNLITSSVYNTGEKINLASSGKAGSDTGVAEVMISKKPRLVLPGLGDRILGHVEDSELLFIVPFNEMKNILNAMEEQAKTNFIVYPAPPNIFYKADFSSIPVIGAKYSEFLKDIEEKLKKGDLK